ncbi:MAG: hypothetical protein V3V31_05965 [Methylococcales bacterium]
MNNKGKVRWGGPHPLRPSVPERPQRKWTERRNDWRTGDDEERSQTDNTDYLKPQASPVAARPGGTTPESRPHRAPV